jgi:hypothetical protein
VREADRPGTNPSFPIGALTSESKDAWSTARAEFGRTHSIELVDRALFVLEDEAPADLDAAAHLFLHGDVWNRCCDKLQFLACTVAGVNIFILERIDFNKSFRSGTGEEFATLCTVGYGGAGQGRQGFFEPDEKVLLPSFLVA